MTNEKIREFIASERKAILEISSRDRRNDTHVDGQMVGRQTVLVALEAILLEKSSSEEVQCPYIKPHVSCKFYVNHPGRQPLPEPKVDTILDRDIDELKPCPCCGGTAEFREYEATIGFRPTGWFIRCMNCEMIRTTKRDVGCTRGSAAICWNRRVQDDKREQSPGS